MELRFGTIGEKLNTARIAARPRPVSNRDGFVITDPQSLGGLIGGTQVLVRDGWRLVEDLLPGEEVLTFDNGYQPLQAIRRVRHWEAGPKTARALWPLAIPPDVLGNKIPMVLAPGQPVLIESDVAENYYGDPFAMVRAASLHGRQGIKPIAPPEGIQGYQLGFRKDEVIYVNGSTLTLCRAEPTAKRKWPLPFSKRADYPVADEDTAELLVDDWDAHRPKGGAA